MGWATNYSADVDANGNTSWTFSFGLATYTIYALDGNSIRGKSNIIAISANLNDRPPSPGFPMDITVIAMVFAGAMLMIRERSRKK
jgi:hypothetical protein